MYECSWQLLFLGTFERFVVEVIKAITTKLEAKARANSTACSFPSSPPSLSFIFRLAVAKKRMNPVAISSPAEIVLMIGFEKKVNRLEREKLAEICNTAVNIKLQHMK